MKHYGYYSETADKKFGHALYRTPEGFTLKVTEATCNDIKPLSLWNDLIFIGEITDCIKPNKVGAAIPLEQLLVLARKERAQQISCQEQFHTTGKCFCCTCPVVNNKN